jgi:hypothetical protein
MATMEKGVHIEKVMRSEADMKPHPTKAKDVELFLSKIKPRRYDKVPLEFTGKGPNGYMLYDWIFHKGVRAPKVSQDFIDIVRRVGTKNEYLVREQHIKRAKAGGVRFAVQTHKRRKF